MNYLREKFLNKEVHIYPSDTYDKFGIVRNISDKGVTFEITKTNEPEHRAHKVGALWFVAWNKLTFEEKQ